jgi:hypothetical protein
LITQFTARTPAGNEAQQVELLLRAAIFKPANELIGRLFPQAADRIDAAYQTAENHLREVRGSRSRPGRFNEWCHGSGGTPKRGQTAECASAPVPMMYLSGDGTGVPMRPEELAGRAGKQTDGTAQTRPAYLGCVFTQDEVDEEGHPVRKWESTT